MSKSFKIAKVVVGLPVDGPFDYAVTDAFQKEVAVGKRVTVLFNRRKRTGFIVGFTAKSHFKQLNPILGVLDKTPALDGEALEFTRTFAAYYGCSWGEAIETYLPSSLRKNKYIELPPRKNVAHPPKETPIPHLICHLKSEDRWKKLGELIRSTLDAKQGVIFLLPQAALIKDAVKRLEKEFNVPVTVFERKTKVQQELAQWSSVYAGDTSIVIGTRSAIFAPMPHCGLIVIYNEENDAYKQEQAPHYHVDQLALMRAGICSALVCFVSSLPRAETWKRAKTKKWHISTDEPSKTSKVQIVDMTNYNPKRSSIISFPLQNAIEATLSKKGRVVVFLNRLGFNTRTCCNQCGHTLKCKRCDANLIYMFSKKKMTCRYCGSTSDLPKMCPNCQGTYLRSSGMGIEKIQSDLARFYPQARVALYEKESQQFPDKADIVIATQAIFRMQESLSVDLVAILNFDSELNRFDFRCGIKAFSLLIHLAELAKEKFIIQTRMADNYCIKAIKRNNRDTFYKNELGLRKQLALPPYRDLVSVGVRGPDEEVVLKQSDDLFKRLSDRKTSGIDIHEPFADVRPKLRDKYWYTIMLKSRSSKTALNLIKKTLKGYRKKKGIVVTVNVNPI